MNCDAQRRTRKSSDTPPPPGHPPHIKTMTTRLNPTISRTTAKAEGIDDPKGAHGHPPPTKTATPRHLLASTTTQIEGRMNSPTSSRTKT